MIELEEVRREGTEAVILAKTAEVARVDSPGMRPVVAKWLTTANSPPGTLTAAAQPLVGPPRCFLFCVPPVGSVFF